MLVAISYFTGTDLQTGILIVLGGNIAFIAALSFMTDIREKLISKVIGF